MLIIILVEKPLFQFKLQLLHNRDKPRSQKESTRIRLTEWKLAVFNMLSSICAYANRTDVIPERAIPSRISLKHRHISPLNSSVTLPRTQKVPVSSLSPWHVPVSRRNGNRKRETWRFENCRNKRISRKVPHSYPAFCLSRCAQKFILCPIANRVVSRSSWQCERQNRTSRFRWFFYAIGLCYSDGNVVKEYVSIHED